MRTIPALVSRLVMVTTMAFAATLAEAQSRAPTPVPPAPATRAPTPVPTTPVTRAPVPVTPQSTDPDLIEQIRELVGGRQSAWSAVLPPESRFQIALVGGEAVLDKETNLVWEKSPSTVLEDWRRANNQCNGMTLGGRKGWRLPTVQELASLLEAGETGTTLPDGHPFATVQPQAYWSATLTTADSRFAWGLNFLDGAVGYLRLNTTRLFWCVRGPGGVDVQ